jgi:hypothetical protein
MPKYELVVKGEKKWAWKNHSSGDWAFHQASMQTRAMIDGGQQDCEIRLLVGDIEALLDLPQVQEMASKKLQEVEATSQK